MGDLFRVRHATLRDTKPLKTRGGGVDSSYAAANPGGCGPGGGEAARGGARRATGVFTISPPSDLVDPGFRSVGVGAAGADRNGRRSWNSLPARPKHHTHGRGPRSP